MTDKLVEKVADWIKRTPITYHSDEGNWVITKEDRIKLAKQLIPIIKKAVEAERKVLFQLGNFTLHSGDKSDFKIDCDAFTNKDLECIAYLISRRHKFGKVIGIPEGGLKLAEALEQYITEGATLIVDDVLTTGKSMEKARTHCKGEVIGVVVFTRNECPDWIRPLFSMVEAERLDRPELREKVEKIIARLSGYLHQEHYDFHYDRQLDAIDEILSYIPDEEEIRKA